MNVSYFIILIAGVKKKLINYVCLACPNSWIKGYRYNIVCFNDVTESSFYGTFPKRFYLDRLLFSGYNILNTLIALCNLNLNFEGSLKIE